MKAAPSHAVKLIRLAVRSRLFSVYEVFDGLRHRINVEPEWSDAAEYFGLQRRFREEELDLETTRRACREHFQRRLYTTFGPQPRREHP